mmetsp:Transcript_63035/g.204407  ORF Transcript_63035/g.204407 Transcript_63035/m.204407 type:complete len:805 (+) Transcript_63035:2698-5112(+)
MTCMAERSARNLGTELNSVEILRMSRLLTLVSEELIQNMTKFMDVACYMPGQEICLAGRPADALYLFLSGSAEILDGTDQPRILGPRSCYGEAMCLGITTVHTNTVRAQTMVVAQSVRRRHLVNYLEKFEGHSERFTSLLKEGKLSQANSVERLPNKMKRWNCFRAAQLPFLEMLALKAEDEFFAPNELIIKIGEECHYGQTPLYVLLAGKAVIEDEMGVMQNVLGPGELIGEGGALGLAATRGSNVRIFGAGCAHCFKITGPSLEDALNVFAEEHATFEALQHMRIEKNMQFQAKRQAWMTQIAMPALEKVTLFPEDSLSFLGALAAPLVEVTYKAGEVITVVGDNSESMLVVLVGTVMAISKKDNGCLGQLNAGAVIGEATGLGISDWSFATVRAATDVRILAIPQEALAKASDMDSKGNTGKVLQRIMGSRKEQVELGLPMSALPIYADKNDAGVQAIALQADRCQLKKEAHFNPWPEDHPAGPHFWCLVKGRAVLEIDVGGGRSPVQVMPIFPGYMLIETLAADYGIRVRALSNVEGYRVRLFDFRAVTETVRSAQAWLRRFEMFEGDTRTQLIYRAEAAMGVASSLEVHRNDEDIRRYRQRRNAAVDRAHQKAAVRFSVPEHLQDHLFKSGLNAAAHEPEVTLAAAKPSTPPGRCFPSSPLRSTLGCRSTGSLVVGHRAKPRDCKPACAGPRLRPRHGDGPRRSASETALLPLRPRAAAEGPSAGSSPSGGMSPGSAQLGLGGDQLDLQLEDELAVRRASTSGGRSSTPEDPAMSSMNGLLSDINLGFKLPVLPKTSGR